MTSTPPYSTTPSSPAGYLPEQARFTHLQNLPEGEDIGKALNEAMKLIEQENEDLRGVLPKNYNLIKDWTLVELLKLLGPVEIDGDAFGRWHPWPGMLSFHPARDDDRNPWKGFGLRH